MKPTTLATILLCCSSAALAAGPMKAGLWEMSIKSDAMKNMPKITPEQMQQMKQMGINVPQMQDGGMVTKVCISKEMAERDQPPEMNRKESGCEARNYQRSGSSYSVDIICDGPSMKGQGKAQGTFSGSDSFTSTYDFKGTAHGHPVDQHHESKGKWLSADCGNVAPLDSMGKAGKK
jgi:hypothetical protein